MNADNQQERIAITQELKWFLAGVIEGEGSVCASIKAHPTVRYGVFVDPEFFIYQHRVGIKLLHLAQQVFLAGRIVPKVGNEGVMVYAITSRRTIYEKVIPFFEKYMTFSAKWETFLRFKEIVVAIEEKRLHETREGMIELVKLAYKMNPDSKGKARKRTLQEVIDIILRDRTLDSKKVREDMVRSA
jgi:hypothetical protein